MEGMGWGNLVVSIIYCAIHVTAGILCIAELFLLAAVRELGLAAWAFAWLWLVLAVLGSVGQISLRRTVWRLLAAGPFPGLCGAVDALWRGDVIESTPAMWAFFLTLLLLAARILLEREKEGDSWERGLALLERGQELSLFLMLWLFLLVGGVLFMATFGMLFSIFIGMLLAELNSFLDYDGVAGILAGLGLMWLLQRCMLLRAWQLAEEDRPGPWFALLVPVWGLVQANRLEKRFRARKWAAERGQPLLKKERL